jgi:hypothetical protein
LPVCPDLVEPGVVKVEERVCQRSAGFRYEIYDSPYLQVRILDSRPKLSSTSIRYQNAVYAIMYLAAHTTMPTYVRRSLNTRPHSRPIFLGKAIINFRLRGGYAPSLVYETVNAVIGIFICWPEVVDIGSKWAISYTAERA